jgi:acyl-CoA thioester hydrolase
VELSYLGSVNSWECDENNHLNVRFCEQKLWQTLSAGLIGSGLLRVEEVDSLMSRTIRQHSRFQNESRLAAPLSGYFGFLQHDEFNVISELRNDATGEVACSALYQIAGLSLGGSLALESSQSLTHALPRGIAEDLSFAQLSMPQALAKQFRPIGQGIIQSDECSGSGLLMLHNYMGRISDSMPHLWSGFADNAEPDPDEGGAVLEFRKRFYNPLTVSDRYVVVSGMIDVAPKVQQFGHLMFNVETEQCCLSAHAVAVRMDLIARKAKTLSIEDQTRLSALCIQSFECI